MITLQILSSSELIHHFHLVLAHLWCNIKKSGFLFILSEIYNACPVLIIFSFEALQEIVEWFIFASHFPDLLIKWFTFTAWMVFYKGLESFHLWNTSWPRQICKRFTLFCLFILEEKHLSFLIPVLIGVIYIWVVHLIAFECGEFHQLLRIARASYRSTFQTPFFNPRFSKI